MNDTPIRIDLTRVKKTRGKSEFHYKPAATALGETVSSYSTPIRKLLAHLVDIGKVTLDDKVDVFARNGTRSFMTQSVAEWLDGRAIGRKPGSHEWLWKNRWKDEDDDEE